jgi:hypothetical protein
MEAKAKAEKLVSDFYTINCRLIKVKNGYDMGDRYNLVMPISKQCALIAVQYIITSNPHSNPLNTQVFSTIRYWQEVKQEILKL